MIIETIIIITITIAVPHDYWDNYNDDDDDNDNNDNNDNNY